MKTISIIGGVGLMATGIVRDLVSDKAITDIGKIRLCDLDADRIEQFIAEIGDDRLESWPLDVSDSRALTAALAEVDLCLNAVPTMAGYQMDIFEAALATGVDYLDLGGLGVYTVKQLEWRDRFKKAGVTAVLGAGADPGMSNVLCRAVADQLDQIEKINLYWAAELVGDENPVLVPPYSVSTVLAEYAHPSTQFLNGKHVECAPLTGAEVLDLPDPWGRTSFIYSPHSEQLTVPLADGIRNKGIREFTWKLHLSHREHEAWVGLVKAGFNDFTDPIEMDGVSIKPVDFLTKMINRNIERYGVNSPAQESHEIHFAIGRGIRDGKRVVARCEVIVRPRPEYALYVDAATSMNASISAQLLLNSAVRPGVWAPEEFFDTSAYLDEVRKRGMQVALSVDEET